MMILAMAGGEVGSLPDCLRGLSVSLEDVVEYLKSGELVLSARGTVADRFEASAPAIPIAYLSDGQWVWSWETSCYVERYQIPLPREFLVHVQQSPTGCPQLSDQDRAEALAVLKSATA